MTYDLLVAQSFWDCVASLRRDDDYKASLVDALTELRRKPFQNPKLKSHGIGTSSNGKKLFASDVGGRRSDRRVVWQLFNKTIVLLLYGTHKVYDRARRMSIGFDPATRQHTVYEQAPDSGTKQPYARQRERIGKLFMAWTDQELASRGLPTSVIAHLRLIDSDDDSLAMEGDLGPYFEIAFDLITAGHPLDQRADGPHDLGPAEAEEPPVTNEDREIERHLTDDQKRIWFTRIEPEFLADVMGKPIEDWMIFLHPDQRSAIQRHYAGPARVRGSAGTGKTVVGLHRAVWLAKRNLALRQERRDQLMPANKGIRPVLFTTFIKTLAPVCEALYMRLPAAPAGEVHFMNVDRLARKMCLMSGEGVNVDMGQVEEAFTKAFTR